METQLFTIIFIISSITSAFIYKQRMDSHHTIKDTMVDFLLNDDIEGFDDYTSLFTHPDLLNFKSDLIKLYQMRGK